VTAADLFNVEVHQDLVEGDWRVLHEMKRTDVAGFLGCKENENNGALRRCQSQDPGCFKDGSAAAGIIDGPRIHRAPPSLPEMVKMSTQSDVLVPQRGIRPRKPGDDVDATDASFPNARNGLKKGGLSIGTCPARGKPLGREKLGGVIGSPPISDGAGKPPFHLVRRQALQVIPESCFELSIQGVGGNWADGVDASLLIFGSAPESDECAAEQENAA
jgi:hypothetical protein